jgi:O-antigen ligase
MDKSLSSFRVETLLLVSVFHVALALVSKYFPALSTIHALITITIGVYISLSTKNSKMIVFIVSYIIGAELFWRMTEANVFWEFGKYASLAVIGIGLLRFKHWKNAFLPLFYLALLSVSLPATVTWFGWGSQAREAISFNFSGPLLLAIAVIFFSQVKLDLLQLKQIAWMVTFPIISVFTLAFFSTITSQGIVFTTESNFTTSGGFGPNQVSAILSLGVVMMFLIILFEKNHQIRFIAFGLLGFLLFQSILTFSRGGLFNVIICGFFAVLHIIRNKRSRTRFLILFLVLILFSVFVIFPRLDNFTNGLLTQRFTDPNLTNRGDIALGEILVWLDYPIFGTGPGISKYITLKYTGIYSAAHTEYTRMLSEHGIFGLLALLILIVIVVRSYIKAPGWIYKTWVVVLLFWPLAEMTHAAMRVATIPILLGMSSSCFQKKTDHENE